MWKTRTWARGITTTYEYDAGMLTLTDYSDTTPDVSMEYDALGRPASSSTLITDHSAPITSSTFTYNPTTLLLDTETISYDIDTNGTPELTRVLDRSQDTLGRESGWVLGSTPAPGVGGGASPPPELVTSYAYNPTDGRLETIRGGGLHPPSQFNYSYLANSNLIKTITSPAHTVTNTYEPNRNILDVKENKAGTTIISKHDYLVNAIGQRSNLAQTGTAFATVFAAARDIAWGYDSLGQVTRADSTIPGLDRAYAFDMIGNRLKTADSLTLPTANNYTPNALNQYSSINNQSSIINPQFDADGNMTAGPLPANVNANSSLIWDGENRLIEAQVTGGATVSYVYDSQSRRIAETVGSNTKITVYDSWNPIAEYGRAGLQPASLAKTYTWGIDLSGSMQGAGGVGGLLMVTVGAAGSVDRYYPTFDGNGNVSEYLNSTGTIAAHYEYDPFGKTTVATGPKANAFAHRFSTKPLDLTTGLYYYGYRFYDPETGRWPSRDPIEERGGLNLYGFVGNDGVNWWDKLGLAPNKGQTTDPEKIIESVKEEIENLKKNGNCKDINIDTLLGNLRDKHSKENRYIYLDDYGWVDLRHFFEAANYAEDTGSVATEVLGFGKEFYQWLDESGDDYKSGFSPEDIPSNSAGAAFGDDYEIQNCCEFSKALKKFFDDKGSRPTNDPKAKWDKLPETDPAEKGGKNRGGSNSNSNNPGNNKPTSSVSP